MKQSDPTSALIELACDPARALTWAASAAVPPALRRGPADPDGWAPWAAVHNAQSALDLAATTAAFELNIPLRWLEVLATRHWVQLDLGIGIVAPANVPGGWILELLELDAEGWLMTGRPCALGLVPFARETGRRSSVICFEIDAGSTGDPPVSVFRGGRATRLFPSTSAMLRHAKTALELRLVPSDDVVVDCANARRDTSSIAA